MRAMARSRAGQPLQTAFGGHVGTHPMHRHGNVVIDPEDVIAVGVAAGLGEKAPGGGGALMRQVFSIGHSPMPGTEASPLAAPSSAGVSPSGSPSPSNSQSRARCLSSTTKGCVALSRDAKAQCRI